MEIEIGDYAITKQGDGTYWIQHRCGEGMQTSEAKMLAMLEELWRVHF